MHNQEKTMGSAIAVLLVFFRLSVVSASPSAPDYYREDLRRICPADGSKKELNLRTSSAIFTLEVPPVGLGGRPFNCHLELEAPSTNYGFHVYMDEMHLLGQERRSSSSPASGSAVDCPLDYVQFARDDLIFTTYKSPRFCGVRPRLNASDEAAVHRAYDGRKLRFYVEDVDREMDLWVRLDGAAREPRNLTLAVTVFKKACHSTDRRYVRCPHSPRCVRRELMCDAVVNCAWPNGDVPYDEIRCDQLNDASTGQFFRPSNLPIIIVVAVVIVGAIAIFAVALRTFYRSVKRPPPETSTASSSVSRIRAERQRSRDQESAPLRQPATAPSAAAAMTEVASSPTTPADQMELAPSAPPKYEDVVEHPPPYTENV